MIKTSHFSLRENPTGSPCIPLGKIQPDFVVLMDDFAAVHIPLDVAGRARDPGSTEISAGSC
jgi:hypothetical protein